MLLYEDLSKAIIGAAIEVYRHLGPGYLESVYENALAKELTVRNIKFERQELLEVIYKGEAMGKFRPEMLVEKIPSCWIIRRQKEQLWHSRGRLLCRWRKKESA